MSGTTELLTAVHRLADRLRALPESALRRGAGAEGLALARELARRAQTVEFPGSVPRELPDAGYFAVGDQLLVAGTDLVEALREVDAEGAGGGSGSGADREGAVGEAVRLVEDADHRVSDAATGKR